MQCRVSCYLRIKRIVDFFASSAGLLLLSPLFAVISVLIKLGSRGPVLFKQERFGQNGELFKILKFRTMVAETGKDGRAITVGNDERITGIGRFLRKAKLDELPQLVNVLKGEMSLVGPRPEVPKYVNMYSKRQRKVLTVKPGMTDYASLRYRNESELLALSPDPEGTYIKKVMPEKLDLNLKYIKDMSLSTDIKLILHTIKKVFVKAETDKDKREFSQGLFHR